MKKSYLEPLFVEVVFNEDVVRCSVGSYGAGDDYISDDKDLSLL